MRLPGFTRFLGRSACSRPLSTSHSNPVRSQLSVSHPTSHLELAYPHLDHGTYSVVLPTEPFQFGTSHIPVLPVPPFIVRPPYVVERQLRDVDGSKFIDQSHADDAGDPWEGDGRIELKSEEEGRLRKAARLAKSVREFAGGLVKVCVSISSRVSLLNLFCLHGRSFVR